MTFNIPAGGYVVLLERVAPDTEPDYPIAGRGTCYRCGHWVWLKSGTAQVVTDGLVVPVCLDCGVE